MLVPISLDLHIPNFNYPGVAPAALFDTLGSVFAAATAR
jgi:hypothetical protein